MNVEQSDRLPKAFNNGKQNECEQAFVLRGKEFIGALISLVFSNKTGLTLNATHWLDRHLLLPGYSVISQFYSASPEKL